MSRRRRGVKRQIARDQANDRLSLQRQEQLAPDHGCQ